MIDDTDYKNDIAKVDARPTRTVLIMMCITVIGKVMGLVRDSMQGAQFGADTPYAVAFVQASALPRNFLDIMFAAALSASFIPVFTARLETQGKREAFRLASLFISVSLVLLGAITLVMVIFAGPLYNFIYVFLPGATIDSYTRQLGAELLRYMLPLMILSGLAFSFTGILQSLGEFRLPAAMSVVSNGVILLYYLLLVDRFGVRGLAVAFIIGWAMQAVIQVPWLIRHKFKFRFRVDLKDKGLREIGALTLPVLAASWMLPVNFQINLIAVGSIHGGAPSLQFAYTLYTIVSGVFILSVGNILFPKLSRLVATGDKAGFNASLGQTVRVLFFFLVPLTLGIMALSQPLVQLVFGHGLFDDSAAIGLTSTALFFFAIGILGYGFQVILCRACFAQKDGRTPLLAAIVAIGVNAVLSFWLIGLGIAGPALASAIGISLGSGVMVVVLTRKGLLEWPAALVLDICKMMVLAGVMFLAVIFLLPLLGDFHVLIQIAVPGIVGAVIYIGGSLLLRVDVIHGFIRGRQAK